MTFKGVAERIGRRYAMWNANRIRGVLVDDTWKASGRILMYHAASDRLVYVDPPAGGSPGIIFDGGSPVTEGSFVIDGGDPGSLHGAIIDCGGIV